MVLGGSCQFLVVLDVFWLFFGGSLWFLVVVGGSFFCGSVWFFLVLGGFWWLFLWFFAVLCDSWRFLEVLGGS